LGKLRAQQRYAAEDNAVIETTAEEWRAEWVCAE
jgi:hypothetical protein